MIPVAGAIDTTELKTKGVQVIRSFFSDEIKQELARRGEEIIELRAAGKLTTSNQDSQGLSDAWFNPMFHNVALIDLMKQILGPNVGGKGHRILAKDKHFQVGVHVHQDWPYNSGDTRKISVFIPLTPMNAANGGLIFFEGSHFYGPVSQGPIDVSRFSPMVEFCPDVDVGDIVICDFLTWHYSKNSENSAERIMLQFNYQPADDPSSNNVLAGKRSHDVVLLSRFDASNQPSVELNCKMARAFWAVGDLDHALRYARGLVYDDPEHSSAALLLCEILASQNDPAALQQLELARSSIKKQIDQLAAFDQRFGLESDLIPAAQHSTQSPSQNQTASPWRPLNTAWSSQVEGYPDVAGLPANLITPDPAWAYGAVSDPLDIDGPATIRIKARVAQGKVGFCLIRVEDGSLASEQHCLGPDSQAPILIAFKPGPSPTQLVMRNWDANTRGEVTVESIDFLQFG